MFAYGGNSSCHQILWAIVAIVILAVMIIGTVGFYNAWKESLSTSAAKGLYILFLVVSIIWFILLVWMILKHCCGWGCCEDPCMEEDPCRPDPCRDPCANPRRRRGYGMGDMGNMSRRSPVV